MAQSPLISPPSNKGQVSAESVLPKELQYALTRGYLDKAFFADRILGMPLHSGQLKWLNKPKAKKNILSPANRWGKSITIAIKHIHANFYKIGIGRGNLAGWSGLEYRTANIAPDSSMTEPVFKAMQQILNSTFPIPQPDGSVKTNECVIGWFLIPERTLNTAPYKLFFRNNSYTEFRTLGADQGDSLQGKPYGYISYDEGGRSDHLELEITDAIMPRLFDWNGELDIVSTPSMNSKSLMYHFELFNKGNDPEDPSVYSQEGSIWENTFYSKEQIQAHVDSYKGVAAAPQVLEGKFVFAGDLMFQIDDIEAAKSLALNDPGRFIVGHKYVMATDTSIGSDEQVHTVLDITDPDQVLQVRTQAHKGTTKSPRLALYDFLDLFDHYNQEGTLGHILETYNEGSARFYMDLPRSVQRKTKTYGTWRPDGVKNTPNKLRPAALLKADMLIALRKLLTERKLRIPENERELIFQLAVYQEDDKKLRQDRLIALALACWYATEGKPKTPTVKFTEVTW